MHWEAYLGAGPGHGCDFCFRYSGRSQRRYAIVGKFGYGLTVSRRDPKQEAPPEYGDEVAIDPTTLRRAPSYRGFMLTGGVLAIIAAWVASRFGEPTQWLDANGMGWLLTATFVPLGVLLGGIVALILDRRSLKAVEKRRAATPSQGSPTPAATAASPTTTPAAASPAPQTGEQSPDTKRQ